MSNNQKLLVAIAFVTLVGAVVVYLYNRNRRDVKPVDIQPVAEPEQQDDGITDLEELQNAPNAGSDKTLVLFFAPWCGHCKNVKPIWDQLAQNFDGYNGVKIVKVNGDEQPQLCQMHGVGGFPTIKYCPDGLESTNGAVYQGDRSMQSIMDFLKQNA